MRPTWNTLKNENKRNDSVELSRFFVFGENKEKRERMRKVFFLFMTFGLVGLMCGSVSGQQGENIIKLKKTGNCKGCSLLKADLKREKLEGANLEGADLKFADLKRANLSEADLRHANLRNANLRNANLSGAYLSGANLSEANLSGTDLSGAYLKDIINQDSAIKCKTIFPWGEENADCKKKITSEEQPKI